MKRRIIILVAALLLCGCEGDTSPPSVTQVKAVGFFMFNNHGSICIGGRDRHVYEVTDTRTGQTFVAITGMGVYELVSQRSGKTTTTIEE
jgi:hypothetical protein